MSRPGDFDNLAGTEVRLDHPSTLPAKTFVLDERLSEDYQTMTQLECDQGLGPPFAAIKFSCHNLLNPAQQGFMRIYCQIPIDGTVFRPPEVRARQAVSEHTHAEIEVLKTLDDQNCAAVPKLLGLRTGLQDAGGYVPSGYIIYVAWERVPGEVIRSRSFWESSLAYREQVRSACSTAYEELRRCGWRPTLIHLGKLIYNDVTKVMYISEFRDPVPIKPDPLSDVTYACWGLAKPSDRLDWYLDSSDWKCNVIYAFSGTQYASVNFASDTVETGPRWITSVWGTFKKAGFGTVYAIVGVPNELNQFYAFYGSHYFRGKIDSNSSDFFVDSGPRSIASGWLGLVEAGYDTIYAGVVNASFADIICVFSGSKTLGYTRSKNEVTWLSKPIVDGWPSLKEACFHRVDAILKKPETDHVYYVFHGNQYVRIHWKGKDGTIERQTDHTKEQWKCLSPWV